MLNYDAKYCFIHLSGLQVNGNLNIGSFVTNTFVIRLETFHLLGKMVRKLKHQGNINTTENLFFYFNKFVNVLKINLHKFSVLNKITLFRISLNKMIILFVESPN